MSKPQSLCCGIREIFILSYGRGRGFHALIRKSGWLHAACSFRMKGEYHYKKSGDMSVWRMKSWHSMNCAIRLGFHGGQFRGMRNMVLWEPGRNPCGYLLYDLQMQTEIQKIHQFQKFGFQVKEIGTLMMLSKPELRERLAAQRIIRNKDFS